MKADNIAGADFLDTLLLRHHITLKAVYDCASAQYDELVGMERILDLKTEEDVRRFLVLPRILEPADADAIIAYFRIQKNGNWMADVPEPTLEEYTVLLISAFIYNTPFFAMAWKRCDLLKASAQKRKQEQQERLTVVRGTPRSKGIDLGKPIKAAASGTDDPVIKREAINQNGMDGELCMVNRGSHVQFIFTFTENADNPPYYVSVQGGQPEPIRLNRRMPGKRLSITSGEIPWEDWNASIMLFREDSNA